MIGQPNKRRCWLYYCDRNLLLIIIVYKNGYEFGPPKVVMVNSFIMLCVYQYCHYITRKLYI